MACHGVGDGWCFSCGAFAGRVMLMVINGAALDPVPFVAPVGVGSATRGVVLASVDDLDKPRVSAWMERVTSVPGRRRATLRLW